MAKATTSSAHTPGPWKVTHRWNGTAILESASTGEVVAEIQKHSTNGLYSVAANARLIAAAPDLLEAIHLALDMIEPGYPEANLDPDVKQIRAAIAKAEGNS